MSDRDQTILLARLVEAVTLLLGENPKWDQMRTALFEALAANPEVHKASVNDE